ncbi:MAG TPA: GNAT family N-acetyltransferase [Candidatus Nanoarchaeia archaeon]|nr:GNAT family N-acetyltransferase [Candidatus Nanoarchaeia archaeon]
MTRKLQPISRKLPRIRKLFKKEFDYVTDDVLKFEKGIWPKSEQWNCKEDFQEVYELPHAVRFGAYTDRLVGFTMGMPTDVARDIYREDDGSPTDNFDLIPNGQVFLWVVEVDSNWRGRKVGKNLVDHVAQSLERKGAQTMYAYLREPIPQLCGRDVEVITPVENYAGDTGKTYYLSKMGLWI